MTLPLPVTDETATFGLGETNQTIRGSDGNIPITKRFPSKAHSLVIDSQALAIDSQALAIDSQALAIDSQALAIDSRATVVRFSSLVR